MVYLIHCDNDSKNELDKIEAILNSGKLVYGYGIMMVPDREH